MQLLLVYLMSVSVWPHVRNLLIAAINLLVRHYFIGSASLLLAGSLGAGEPCTVYVVVL